MLKEEEAEVERRKKQNNFNHYKLLQQKMNLERYNYEEKVQKHIENKKDVKSRVGPGAYIDPKKQSEFKVEQKPEYLQFFGSTEERFKNNIPGGITSSAGTITGLGASASLAE